MIATARGKVILQSRGWRPNFLLRDDFLVDAAAPLASPRTAEPGPGTGAIVDTGNHLAISSGKMRMTGCHTSNVSPAIAYTPTGSVITGTCHMFIGIQFAVSQFSNCNCGFRSNSAAAGFSVQQGDHTVRLIQTGGSTFESNAIGFSDLTPFDLYTISTSGGFHYLIKKAGVVTLLYPRYNTMGNPAWHIGNTIGGTGGEISVDSIRECNLPAPFNTDYGIVTQRLAGSVAAGTTFTHEANCVLEFTLVTKPSVGSVQFQIREQDSNNCWRFYAEDSGNFSMSEIVAGSATQRASAAAGLANGHRIVIVADGTTIRGYSNNVLRWTYSSASNFATATAGKLSSLGTGGVVSEVISWPRTLSGAAAAALDLAVAA